MKRWYGPAWNAAAKAQGWNMAAQRLAASRPTAGGQHELNAILLKVWGVAECLADQQDRGVRPEDLRHGCNAVAVQRVREWRSGKPAPLAVGKRETSAKEMTNLELELSVVLFNWMADADDLRSAALWTDPSDLERRRLVKGIEKHQEGYVRRICADKFGTHEWRNLRNDQLRQLITTVRNRPGCHSNWQRRQRTEVAA